jgi:hypothetical protein
MSYCRFGEDGSDVYIFASVRGGIECCGCWVNSGESINVATQEEMLHHINLHRRAGHHVPYEVDQRLSTEIIQRTAKEMGLT